MKIYLAGKWTEKKDIKDKMNELIEMGHTITHDWTSFESEGKGVEKKQQSAIKDIQAVRDCDILVAIMNDKTYPFRGTFTEIGCGLGLNKPIIILCQDDDAYCTTNCFYYHPNIKHFKTWNQVLKVITNF